MIIFKNWEIKATKDVIARQYDNLPRVLLVAGDLPEGYTWDLLVQVGKAMDIIHLETMEGGVGAALTADQLSLSGYYQMQLRGTQGAEVRHTNIIPVHIPPSLSGDGQWPTVPSEFTQVERSVQDAANRAENAAVDAEADAALAAQSAVGAGNARDAACQSAAVAEPVFAPGSTYWLSVVPLGGKYLAVWTEVTADGTAAV